MKKLWQIAYGKPEKTVSSVVREALEEYVAEYTGDFSMRALRKSLLELKAKVDLHEEILKTLLRIVRGEETDDVDVPVDS